MRKRYENVLVSIIVGCACVPIIVAAILRASGLSWIAVLVSTAVPFITTLTVAFWVICKAVEMPTNGQHHIDGFSHGRTAEPTDERPDYENPSRHDTDFGA